MKAAITLLLCVACPTLALAGQATTGNTKRDSNAKVKQTSELNRHDVSYAIGYRFGSEFADGDPAVDIATLVQAVKDAYEHHSPRVPAHTMREQLHTLGQQMHQRALASFRKLARSNASKSAEFMRENAKKSGVVTLPSGVQYKVLEKGQGAMPGKNSVVVINYRGSLINGMEFDSSWAHGKPVTYAVEKMLPGWRDVLPRMHEGARWKVFIPPAQAYGVRGELPRIGPNEALIFDIQLLHVKKAR